MGLALPCIHWSRYFRAFEEPPYETPLVAQVGTRLLQGRINRGWSQELLSERGGTSVQHLSKVERGIVNASLDVIEALTTPMGIAGEYAIEGLEGRQLEERLLAVGRSYRAFEQATVDATNSRHAQD